MKNKINFWKKNWWKCLSALVIIGFLVACSIKIESITIPEKVNAGETFTIDLEARWKTDGSGQTSYLVIGFLAPKAWVAKQNTKISFTCPSLSKYNEVMKLMPADAIANHANKVWATALKDDGRFGLEGNLLDDVEWVVFRSETPISVGGNNDPGFPFTVKIETKAGQENMLVNLGFFVGNESDGLTSDNQYVTDESRTIEVINGEGDVIDFIHKQIAMMELPKATDNDIQTIHFDGDVLTTPLSNEKEIFLCAKAFVSDGQTIEICDRSAKTAFKPEAGINRFRFDFWPRNYFNIAEGKTISKMEYFLVNADGTKKVGYGGSLLDTDPFKFTFKCD